MHHSSANTIPRPDRYTFQLLILLRLVVAADGFSYERSAIEIWFRNASSKGLQVTSPKTNQILEHLLLTPNRNLKSLIYNRRQQQVNQQIPGISLGLGIGNEDAFGKNNISNVPLGPFGIGSLSLEGETAAQLQKRASPSSSIDQLQSGTRTDFISIPLHASGSSGSLAPIGSTRAPGAERSSNPSISASPVAVPHGHNMNNGVSVTEEEKERRALQDLIDMQLKEIRTMTSSPGNGAPSAPAPVGAGATPPKAPQTKPEKAETKHVEGSAQKENQHTWTAIASRNNTAPPPTASKPSAASAAPKPAAVNTSAAAKPASSTPVKAASTPTVHSYGPPTSKNLLCPSSRVRYVVGTKGSILKKIMTKSGATVTTSMEKANVIAAHSGENKTDEAVQIFAIKGSKDAVSRAEGFIRLIIAEGSSAIDN